MARYVADCAALYNVIKGGDPQSLWPKASSDTTLCANAKSVRIGVDRKAIEMGDETMAGLVALTIEVLREQGAVIVEIELPEVAPAAAWSVICAAEVANAHSNTFPSQADEYGADLRK
ncbi:MAG: amidase [Oceanicoccus sp.]|jgi:amidase